MKKLYTASPEDTHAMICILRDLQNGYDHGDPVINEGEYSNISDVLDNIVSRMRGEENNKEDYR